MHLSVFSPREGGGDTGYIRHKEYPDTQGQIRQCFYSRGEIWHCDKRMVGELEGTSKPDYFSWDFDFELLLCTIPLRCTVLSENV